MTMDISAYSVLATLLFLLLGLGFTIMIDPYIQRKQRRIMLIIAALCLSLIAQNYWENVLFISRSGWVAKNILSAYGYSARPVFLLLFLHIVFPEEKRLIHWAVAGVNALLYFSSPFTKLCFEIRKSDFAALRGPLGSACFLVSGILLLELLIRTMIRYRETKRLEQLIPVSSAIFIVISVALDMGVGMRPQPISFLTCAIIASSIFYYSYLHLQFVREHERDFMASQRMQLMMTQIQPHFLFNTLNTIRALYAKDTALADRTLESFSTYLRQNLESLSQSDLIPISKELEHTRLYVEIEMLRFPNVRVEYRIEDENFRIPSLTIQPLVENAIRHGVRSRKDGLVTVSTVREGSVHRITIEDNGVGFDVKEKVFGKKASDKMTPDKKMFHKMMSDSREADEGTQIGLHNVKERVELICGGTMSLQSVLGTGTTVTILIPDIADKNNKDT
ncbi:MAG: histidine kinase [Lachnospiraceae bacterium]|nr:histidine kinase [Lachnospiraceae bacterium]